MIRLKMRIYVMAAAGLVHATPGLGASADSVRIRQDRYGVSHVVGTSRESVAYGFGYAIARDRGQQLEAYRQRATGTRSAVHGPGQGGSNLLRDYRSRLLYGGPELVRDRLSTLRPERATWLAAYAAGINRCRQDHPLESPKGNRLERWTTEDVAAICLSLGFESGDQGELQGLLALQHLIDRYGSDLGQRLFKDIWPKNNADVHAISHVEAHRKGEYTDIPDRIWEALTPETIRTALDGNRALKLEAERLGLRLGSNAWVVAPHRSATGHALLHGAPALGLREVPPLYEIHLRGGGIDAAGVAFGGIPAVAIGHNAHNAWSVTSGNCDQIDLYVEVLHPDDDSLYRHHGTWRPMSTRQESIAVKDRPAQVVTVYETMHGPVVAWDRQTRRAIARSRAGYGDLAGVVESMLGIMDASDLETFRKAASRSPKSLNYLFADDAGNIAHFHTGRQRIRAPGHSGLLPIPGTGAFDSSDLISWEAMPHTVNPPSGTIAAANNQPGTGYGHPMRGGQWGPIDRSLAIEAALTRSDPMTLADLDHVAAVVTTYSGPGQALVKPFVEAVGTPEDERTVEALNRLEQWDFRTAVDDRRGTVGAAIFGKWFSLVQRRLFAGVFGTLAQEKLARPTANTVHRLMKGTRSGLPLLVDYMRLASPSDTPVSLHTLLRQTLKRALAQLEDEFGSDAMDEWTRDVGEIDYGALGRMPSTLKRGTYTFQVSVQSGFPGAESVLFPGNIQDRESPHHADQVAPYRERRFKPMLYTDAEVLDGIESTTTLAMPSDLYSH